MFKKNRALSVVGLIVAATLNVWFDAPWDGSLNLLSFIILIVNCVAFGAMPTLLIQSLRNGTYGQ